MPDLNSLLVITVGAPGVVFLFLSLAWLLGVEFRERFLARLTTLTFAVSFAGAAAIGAILYSTGARGTSVRFGQWFAVHSYEFPLELTLDWLSLPLLALTVVLVGLVGSFSTSYMHREPGFSRFFILLHLFAFGAMLAFTAGSLDLLVGGWELVAITSVFLVAFFQDRSEPVHSALRIFAVYRACDIGLLVGVFVLHHLGHTTTFSELLTGVWPNQTTAMTTGGATLAGLLLLLAACGKSAQFPFSGWLPRAMEGPTPSSAIFYGAISIHLGAYLLLRIYPILKAAPAASAAVAVIGALTAFFATLSGRTCPDAKTSVAYAAMTQVGIIFVEIGLGFPVLAQIHIVGHAAARTLQFLRTPSMMREFHGMHSASGGQLSRTGVHYETLLSEGMRNNLYRLGIERGFQDSILDRFITAPVEHLASALWRRERRLTTPPAPQPIRYSSFPLGETAERVTRGIDG